MRLSDRVATLGGADPRNPREPDHHIRHLFVGTLLLTIAVWAFLGTTEAFHTLLPLPVAAVVGLVIAIVVLSVDVLITVTPLTADTVGHRARILLARGLISLAMGMVIGLSTIMYMYQGSIAQITSEHNKTAAAADAKAITASSQWPTVISADKNKVANAQSRIASDNADIKNAQDHLASLNKQWLNDQICVSGQRAADGNACGSGPVTQQLKQEINTYQHSTLPGIEQTDNADIKSADSEISQLNGEIGTANAKLSAQVTGGTKADLADTDLAAQANALVSLLKQDKLAWVWPIFFFIVDLAVALMKALLPESGFDRRRRDARKREDAISNKVTDSAEWDRVAEHKARREADVMIARIDADADREIAALRSGPNDTRPSRTRVLPGRVAWAGGSAAVAVVLTLALTAGLHGNASSPVQAVAAARPAGEPAAAVQTIALKGGEKLTVPAGAISGNAPVRAAYTTSAAWSGNAPASPEVTFTTTGRLVGKPVLSLEVSGALASAAASGALHLAFRSTAPGGWTDYPVTYNANNHTVTAALTHFSTWEFWTWDWDSILADISQTAGEWEGRRATSAPDCSGGPATPSWYDTSAGISNEPGLVVRACVKGHTGNVLDVEMVNNRPYGLILNYGGAAVQWGWHADPASATDALRDAIGDAAAHAAGGLYLPPLSSASVGIMDLGNGADHTFSITPMPATVLGDALDMTLNTASFINDGVFAGAKKWGSDVFAAAASGACSQFLSGYTIAQIPDESTVMSWLSGAPACIRDILAVAAHNEISQADGADQGTIDALAKVDSVFQQLVKADKVVSWENDAGNVLDFTVDQKAAAVPQLGFGFNILDHYTYQGPTTPTQTAQPTQPSQPAAPGGTPPTTGGGAPVQAPPSAAAPAGGQPVTVYDNYGAALTGYAVCRGNPGRPESMPGGTVSQTYTVPPGVSTLTGAVVQIDPAPVTVAATLSDGGAIVAQASATAAGDTTFNFGSVTVKPGDAITLTLTMTATSGKITTVYSAAGTPGQFTITDTCSDGATNITTAAAGLRSKLLGISQ